MHVSLALPGAEEGVGVGLDDGDLLGTRKGAFDGKEDSIKLGLMVGEKFRGGSEHSSRRLPPSRPSQIVFVSQVHESIPHSHATKPERQLLRDEQVQDDSLFGENDG